MKRSPACRAAGVGLLFSCVVAGGILTTSAFAQAPASRPGEALASILTPHGKPIGFASKKVRELPGGETGAARLLAQLTAGATDVTPPDFKGKVYKRTDGVTVTYVQPFAGGPPPMILIQAPKLPIRQLQFPPNPGKDGGGDS